MSINLDSQNILRELTAQSVMQTTHTKSSQFSTGLFTLNLKVPLEGKQTVRAIIRMRPPRTTIMRTTSAGPATPRRMKDVNFGAHKNDGGNSLL